MKRTPKNTPKTCPYCKVDQKAVVNGTTVCLNCCKIIG